MWIGEIQAEIVAEVEVGVVQGSLNGAQELADVIGQGGTVVIVLCALGR